MRFQPKIQKKSPKFLFLVCNSPKHDYLTSSPRAVTKQSFFNRGTYVQIECVVHGLQNQVLEKKKD